MLNKNRDPGCRGCRLKGRGCYWLETNIYIYRIAKFGGPLISCIVNGFFTFVISSSLSFWPSFPLEKKNQKSYREKNEPDDHFTFVSNVWEVDALVNQWNNIVHIVIDGSLKIKLRMFARQGFCSRSPEERLDWLLKYSYYLSCFWVKKREMYLYFLKQNDEER